MHVCFSSVKMLVVYKMKPLHREMIVNCHESKNENLVIQNNEVLHCFMPLQIENIHFIREVSILSYPLTRFSFWSENLQLDLLCISLHFFFSSS